MPNRPTLLAVLAWVAVACGAPEPSTSESLRRGQDDDGPSSLTQTSTRGGGASTGPSTGTKSTAMQTPAPTAGCAAGTKTAKDGGLFRDRSIEVRGETRTYDLEVPSTYDPTRPYPLVFVFHGSGGWAAQVRIGFDFASAAGDKAIFVYPNGRNAEWDLTSKPDQNGDIALFDTLTERLSADYCVDSARVFSTGFSNGAFFSNQLGCRRGNKLRAIASHGGGGPYGPDEDYDPEGHMKVCVGPAPAALIVHGTGDLVVGVSNGPDSLKHWSWANQCQPSTTAVSPSPCAVYDGCKTPVEGCIIPLMGHMLWWEGTKVTWQFFAQF